MFEFFTEIFEILGLFGTDDFQDSYDLGGDDFSSVDLDDLDSNSYDVNEYAYVDLNSDEVNMCSLEDAVEPVEVSAYEDIAAIEGEDFVTWDESDWYTGPDGTNYLAPISIEDCVITAGDPVGSSEFYFRQELNDTCHLASSRSVIQAVTGIDVPEEMLVDYAREYGFYQPGLGTSVMSTETILRECGISSVGGFDASLSFLEACVANGNEVMISVDASEISSPQIDENGVLVEQEDLPHTVRLTGFGVASNGEPVVMISDPGVPNGACQVVRVSVLEASRADVGGYATIVTGTNTAVA